MIVLYLFECLEINKKKIILLQKSHFIFKPKTMNTNSYLNNSSGYRNPSLAPSNSASNLNSFNKCTLYVKKDNFPIKENNKSSISNMNKSTQMGLNPNLNIEDEYVENLLKQVHFMNMEIKLLKEKQSQSDNNALWGIVNRTK